MLDLRAEIEARLDFSDEGDVSEDISFIAGDLERLRQDLETALRGASAGRKIREGIRVALAGPPNAGKSSLLNALAGSEVAIVTDEPGTTRDVKDISLELGGQLVVFYDLAGLRDTASKAEAEGIRRAREVISGADLVLWLVAPDAATAEAPQTDAPVWHVHTKADISGVAEGLAISTRTGHGLSALMERISAFAAEQTGGHEQALVSHERDVQALERAVEAVAVAEVQLDQLELAAESLREASAALERLLGRLDAEMVLDRLFAGFCIGK